MFPIITCRGYGRVLLVVNERGISGISILSFSFVYFVFVFEELSLSTVTQ